MQPQVAQVLLYTLLGVALTWIFFVIAVVTTYHIDLRIAEFLFPYSVIADPYINFRGSALFLAGAQWPFYGFVWGLHVSKRSTRIGNVAFIFVLVLAGAHLIATGFAYHRHNTRPLVVGEQRNPYSPTQHNKSLDASGGGVCRSQLGAAKGALIRAAASTPPFGGFALNRND